MNTKKLWNQEKSYLKEIIVFLIIEYERNQFIASPAPISKNSSTQIIDYYPQ